MGPSGPAGPFENNLTRLVRTAAIRSEQHLEPRFVLPNSFDVEQLPSASRHAAVLFEAESRF